MENSRVLITPRPPEFDIPEKCPRCGRVTVYRDNHGLKYCTVAGCGYGEYLSDREEAPTPDESEER